MPSPAQLLEAVRKEAKPGIWSQGVNLQRAGAVALESQKIQEVELKVKSPGRAVAQSVVLSLEYESWECDCPSRVDPCEHVVAAVLALSHAQTQSAPLKSASERWSRLLYRFYLEDNELRVVRMWAHADGTTSPLDESLTALLAKPAKGAMFQVEPHDLTADRLFERTTRLPLSPERLEGILKQIHPSKNVFFEGKPVSISNECVLPYAHIEDVDDALVVTVEKNPRVTQVLTSGIVLCEGMLCRLGEVEMTGSRLEKLPLRQRYPLSAVGELTARVIPELARRMPLDIRSQKLPPLDRDLKPRINVELTQIDAGLSVLPTLVYGAPPQVRIDNGKMVFLRGSVPLRDVAEETRLTHQLREELNLVPGHRTQATGPEMTRFLDKLRTWRGGLSGDASRMLGKNVSLSPSMQLSTQVGADGQLHVAWDMQFQVQGGEGTVEASAVLRAWQEGLGLVPLLEGGWAPLPAGWLAQHGERVANLLAAKKENGEVANHSLTEVKALCDALEYPTPPALQKLAQSLESFESLPPAVLPESLTATLRPYQQQGVSWLQFLKANGMGGVLADDMGLGKTLQTLCALEKNSLVVCPTSVLPNWVSEAQRFRPNLKVCAYHGPHRTLDESADLVITTYALLRLDVDVLAAKPWQAVVLDEAQAIKNPDSQVSRAAYQLKADFRLALSGTPVENRLEDLWSLFHFCNPGFLGGRKEFQTNVAVPMADGNLSVSQKLRKRIRPFVLRRLKKDVALELPPRTESVLRVQLTDSERAVYDAVYAGTRNDVLKLLNEGGNVLQALEALLRLRQAACHSALVPGQRAATSSKVETLVEALQTAVADGHKALVFSQWTSLLNLMEPHLRAAALRFDRLDGSTPNRGDIVSRFQQEEGAPILLLSLKAGGTGLNLTSADHVFLVDPWWNPAVEAQAADRAHRIGQERPVNVYRMISEGTVEEKILLLQDKKRALFESAFGDTGGSAATLSKDDLLELFA